MTAKQMFDALLTELSKVNAPSMLLQDFNYFMNKAVYQYINKRYNIYDINQQTTDDLRVLKATATIPIAASNYNTGFVKSVSFDLPEDYLHMLNCICLYDVTKRNKCYNLNDEVPFAAKRLTADAWSIIINDYYNRPLPWRPYYYIHNVNTSNELPTNPMSYVKDGEAVTSDNATDPTTENINDTESIVKLEQEKEVITSIKYTSPEGIESQYNFEEYDVVFYTGETTWKNDKRVREILVEKGWNPDYVTATVVTKQMSISLEVPRKNFKRHVNLKEFDQTSASTVERVAGVRYGNPTKVRCEIRYGNDVETYKLKEVYIDYIKTPQTIRLTQEQVDKIEDTSQILEFPDYVCQEIVNELVTLVMENTADPRLQTHIPITQSIANSAQSQQQTTQS